MITGPERTCIRAASFCQLVSQYTTAAQFSSHGHEIFTATQFPSIVFSVESDRCGIEGSITWGGNMFSLRNVNVGCFRGRQIISRLSMYSHDHVNYRPSSHPAHTYCHHRHRHHHHHHNNNTITTRITFDFSRNSSYCWRRQR